MVRDRRGAGVAEYALLLFIVLAVAGLTYRFLGGRVKQSGNKTEEQFQGGGSGNGPNAKNDKSGAAGTGSAAGTAAPGSTDTAGSSGGTKTASGGGAAAGGAGAGKSGSAAPGNAADDQGDDSGTPIWKIIGGVIVVLFFVGGYFAFRKQKSSG